MDAMECIRTRRSVRKFTDEKVPRELIAEIVSLASCAPSWKNTQVVRYHVIENDTIKHEIAENCVLGFSYNTDTIANAPQLMAVTAVTGRSGMERDGSASTDKGESWLMFDAGAAAQTFCLAAHAKGVGTVIMGYFDAEKVRGMVGFPETETLVSLIPFGFPAETPEMPRRKDLDTLLHFEE